jgi:hypothetical protein
VYGFQSLQILVEDLSSDGKLIIRNYQNEFNKCKFNSGCINFTDAAAMPVAIVAALIAIARRLIYLQCWKTGKRNKR